MYEQRERNDAYPVNPVLVCYERRTAYRPHLTIAPGGVAETVAMVSVTLLPAATAQRILRQPHLNAAAVSTHPLLHCQCGRCRVGGYGAAEAFPYGRGFGRLLRVVRAR